MGAYLIVAIRHGNMTVRSFEDNRLDDGVGSSPFAARPAPLAKPAPGAMLG